MATAAPQALAFVPTAPQKIVASLDRLFSELPKDGILRRRSVNSNLVMTARSRTELEAVEPLIDALSVAYPSRFFLLYPDESLRDLDVSVAARCHALSKSEMNCSELVRIGLPPGMQANALSLLRATLVTGASTATYLPEPVLEADLTRQILRLSEMIVFDSAQYESNPTDLGKVFSFPLQVVDLQWVALSIWREQIRVAFERHDMRELLPHLSEIEIHGSVATPGATSPAALLLGAWLLNRLSLELAGFDGETVLASREGGWKGDERPERVRLRLSMDKNDAQSQLREVRIRFNRGGKDTILRLERGESLETTVTGEVSYHGSRALEEDSTSARILRFFLVGESTFHYQTALHTALRLFELARAGREAH